MNDFRSLMLRALLLDWFGQVLILLLILFMPTWLGNASAGYTLQGQWAWIAFVLVLYPFLGWLFGSYTLLRWSRVSLSILLQRLLITASITLIVVATARWLFNPSETVWLVYRRVQLVWIGALTIWALAVRVALRRGLLLPDPPKFLLLAQSQELKTVLTAWQRVPHRQRLYPIDITALAELLDQINQPILVAVSQEVLHDRAQQHFFSSLEMRDLCHVRTLSVLSLFEQQQERLPPILMADAVLDYDDLPWTAPFSVQAQLKRMADLLLAVLLLLFTSPFIFFAMILIWLEDRGPVFYSQRRSGWLGRPFTIYKLRTMSVQPSNVPASWTKPGDHRITTVGRYLRRVRLDELPQLLNVVTGEMSLIGPRPERPELEKDLEQRIPHYRKRHWMRPGLSGWAQVCAPYASSIEDSDLKLSYDLYYLRNFSTWLDFVILMRTVKTVLKAGGR